jgi:hypothetical protein
MVLRRGRLLHRAERARDDDRRGLRTPAKQSGLHRLKMALDRAIASFVAQEGHRPPGSNGLVVDRGRTEIKLIPVSSMVSVMSPASLVPSLDVDVHLVLCDSTP